MRKPLLRLLTRSLLAVAVISGAATDTFAVVSPPTFAMSFAPDAIALNDSSTMTLTIDNSANAVPATGLDFTYTLPAGLINPSLPVITGCFRGLVTLGPTSIAYTDGSIAAGGICTMIFLVTGIGVGSHAGTTGDLTSSLGNSGPASATLVVVSPPAFDKSFAPDAIAPNGLSTLTFLVDNTTSVLPATSLAFTDTLPAGVVIAATPNASTTCLGGTLTAAAASSSIVYSGGSVVAGASCSLKVDVRGASVGSYTNTSGSLTSSLGNSGTATDTLMVQAPDLTVSKANTVGGATALGNTWDWRSTVVNGGNAAALFANAQVIYTDTLPSANISYGVPSIGDSLGITGTVACALDAGHVIRCVASEGVAIAPAGSLRVDVTATPSTIGTLTNPTGGAARVDPDDRVAESQEGNNDSNSDSVIVTAEADLQLTKIDTPDPVRPGANVTYTITAVNAGPSPATTVVLADALPGGTTFVSLTTPVAWSCATPAVGAGGAVSCSLPSLAPGSAVFTLVVAVVDPLVTPGTGLTNTATVSSVTTDPNPGDESATATTDVAALSLTKTSSATSFTRVGDVLPYSLVATNSGSIALTGVTIVDPLLPALACTPLQPGTLAPGASLTCTGSHTVTPLDVAAGVVTNTATASGQSTHALNLTTLVPEGGVGGAAVNFMVVVTAQGTVTVPGIAPGVSGTRLTLAACTLELQQDWQPRFTKLQFDVWNEDEIKFTGAFECADSWHETDFGETIDAASQNFTVGVLGTYGARYRVQAVTSTQCPGARATGLLGVQSFLVGPNARAVGSVLAGAGKFTGSIRWDPAGTVPEGGIR